MQMKQRLSRLESRSDAKQFSIRVLVASDGGGPDDTRPPISVRVYDQSDLNPVMNNDDESQPETER